MIAKTSTGSQLRPLLRYVAGEDRATRLGGFGFGFDVDTDRREDIAIKLMEHDGADSRKVKNPFMQIILAWHPEQSPDQDEQMEASRSFLDALGMPRARTIVYRHDDKPHKHVHLVGSRFNPDTRGFYTVHQSINKGIAWSIKWEQDHGIPSSRWKDLSPGFNDDYWRRVDEMAKNGPELPSSKHVRELYRLHKNENSTSYGETFRRMMRRHQASNEREDATLATTVGTKARERYQGMGL
jgi:hypothetical protein